MRARPYAKAELELASPAFVPARLATAPQTGPLHFEFQVEAGRSKKSSGGAAARQLI
jgi:hypothetical protein